MTKQDYEALAALIKVQQRTPGSLDWSEDLVNSVLENLARDMAQYLASQNPRFDEDRFLAAAGVQPAGASA